MLVCHGLVAALLLLTRISADSNTCNIEFWKSAIDESCTSSDSQIAQQLVLNASACSASIEFNQELRLFTPEPFLSRALQPRTQGVDTNYNASNIIVVVNFTSNGVNASEELNRDFISYYDGFIVDAEQLPDFAQLDVVAQLDKAINSEPELNWYRINRFYRGFSATHSTKVYGVPLGGAGVFTFYRQDLFSRYNLTIPTTWEGLLATAQAWNVAPRLPGVSPFCMSRRSYCARTLLLSIAAPYMQASGTRAGFLIDPANGTILLNSTGFMSALRMWQQLAALSALDANTSCGSGSDRFAEGKCLMTVQLFEKFKVYASNKSSVSSELGVALPPGSLSVMNRSTGAVEPCTQASCPYAISVVQVASRSGDRNAGGNSGSSSSILVNLAPFMWGGLVGMVSSRNPARIQSEVLSYFASITSNQSLDNVLRQGSLIAPFRADHWSPAAKRNWTDAGYVDFAVSQMQEILRRLHACPNLAPQLRLPGQEAVSRALSIALANLTAGQTPEAVAAALQAAAEEELLKRYGMINGTYGFLSLYRQQLGYVESTSSESRRPPDHGSASGVSRQTVVVIAVVIGLVVLLGAVVVLEVRNKRRHKDLLGRVKPPLGDPDTTIVVASIQDFDELWEVLISDASERALQQFSDLVDTLLRRHSGYRAPSEEEDVVVAFHCPRDACEFALELQRRLLHLRWPKHVLEMKQFKPQYLAQTKRAASFNQSHNGARARMPPLTGSMPAEEDDKLFTLDTGTENVRSFGEQCVASWIPADATTPDVELVFCGIRARVGVCAVGFSQLALDMGDGHNRFSFLGEAVEVAAAAASAAQGGMVLIPQSTFRQLHLEVLADQCLFCHLGEYQLTAELPPMDLYLALDRQLLGRLALFGPLACHMQWSQGAFAAPVHSASMVFTHVVGVQTLLAWNYDLMQDVIETFTKLAQVELQQAGGYLVEHVEGFMLTAFHSPADAILWGLRMQELMLKEDWPEELLAHELCEEVTVTVPVRGGDVTSATVFRGPRLKTGIDIGHVLARLHTMTGRMTYRGKVMNRAARISAAASSGQVLCSSEAWEACTASGSALRLVSATSLGLFQLKGIQERIEVFHCTYQRQVPGSTRRSSTVSVGIVSSSDNRRKSAVVLSSMSHASHHTTSYRTSLHNSVALEHVSTSDATGGRRGSQASSAALVGRGSLGGGQLSDMLHTVGADPDRMNPSGGGAPGAAVAGAISATSRHRAALGAVLAGGADSATLPARPLSQTGSSHRSQGSGAAGPGNTLASRAALTAVLQSRTRSASAIQANSTMAPIRSVSARTRRPVGLSGSVVASEPQVSLASGCTVPAGQLVATKWAAGMATSPSATPSLAMATAAAAAVTAAHERSNNNNNNNCANLQKTAAMLEVPRGVSGNCNMLDSASTHSNLAVVSGFSGGTNAESLATVTAAVYAVLPSVVLSGGVLGSSSGVSPAAQAHGHGDLSSAFAAPTVENYGERSSSIGDCQPPTASFRDDGSELQTLATIATFVGSVLFEGACTAVDASAAATDLSQSATKLQPMSEKHCQHRNQSGSSTSSPAFQFERVMALQPLEEDPPPAEGLCDAEQYPCGTGGTKGDNDGMLDEGSRVETLEVTVSATGIARGALSGCPSSTGFGPALSSSHGTSQGAAISRCGSATNGISYLALGASSGLGSSPSGTALGGVNGAGSHASSCGSSGFGNAAYAQGHLTALRTQSTAMWRALMSMSPPSQPPPHGFPHGAVSAGMVAGRCSGSANSAELFLPLSVGATSGIRGTASRGGIAHSTSNGITATMGISSPANDAHMGSGGAMPSMNSQEQRSASDGGIGGMEAASKVPMLVPTRYLATAHNGRLAAVAATAATESAADHTSPDAGPSAVRGIDMQATEAYTPTAASRSGYGALPLEVAADTVAKAAVIRLRAVTFNAGASGDTSGSVVISASEARSNGSNLVVTGAGAASSPAAINLASNVAGSDGGCNSGGGGGRLSFVGAGGGSSSGGRLRPNNRTGSGVSNELTSQAVSPASTWASGVSAGSAVTNAMTTNDTTLPGAASTSPSAASAIGLEQSLQTRKLQARKPRYQHHSSTNSLRVLLEGVGIGVDAGSGSIGSTAGPVLQGTSDVEGRDDDVPVMEPDYTLIESHQLHASGLSMSGANSTGAGGAADNDAVAMAAVFGIAPAHNEYTAVTTAAATAAAFGVGAPLQNYGDGDAGAPRVGGPTREQLELALELLGESRHAAGGGWR